MKILVISEHFFPRVAGTTEYVSKTCTALSNQGHEIHLLIPGNSSENEPLDGFPYKVTQIGVGWPTSSDPSRSVRYQFCRRVSEYSRSSAKTRTYDILHVMYGMFVAEVLDTRFLTAAGLPCVLTIHNLPPQECGRSWKGDTILNRFKDKAKLLLVSLKNRRRIKASRFSAYVVPSDPVKIHLSKIKPKSDIKVIPHGYDESLASEFQNSDTRKPRQGAPIEILTVGGWMPHKRQHLVPEIAAKLRNSNIRFIWRLAGPHRRSPNYKRHIASELEEKNLIENVKILGPVSNEELHELYEKANLYVQPSTEEGFCITALNAASNGIPVIGCPTGALSDICKISGGTLTSSSSEMLSEALIDFIDNDSWGESTKQVADRVRTRFTWDSAARSLSQLYSELATSLLN